MKSSALLVISAVLAFAVPEAGGARDMDIHDTPHGHPAKLRFVYDADFDFRFDNREYDRSSLAESMTIFGARLTPSVGLQISPSPKSEHRLMVGIDVMKNFGDSIMNAGLFHEIKLYYRWRQQMGRTEMTLVAGVFPRSEMQGMYSTAFFSDSLKFHDPNIEGLILKFRRPGAYYEVGCDWMGQFGRYSRERFMVFSSGEARLAGQMLLLGYAGTLYHYASSMQVWGVVDNILLNPYIGTDLSRMAGLQSLRISLGWLQSFQNDRRNIGEYVFPGGAELLADLRNWNAGVSNRLYYGTGIMPYYDCTDAAGTKYGNSLYSGDPFWRLGQSASSDRPGIYDRLDVYYEPLIAPFLKLRVELSFHFCEKNFAGWQQVVSLKFDLGKLTSSDRRPLREKNLPEHEKNLPKP